MWLTRFDEFGNAIIQGKPTKQVQKVLDVLYNLQPGERINTAELARRVGVKRETVSQIAGDPRFRQFQTLSPGRFTIWSKPFEPVTS